MLLQNIPSFFKELSPDARRYLFPELLKKGFFRYIYDAIVMPCIRAVLKTVPWILLQLLVEGVLEALGLMPSIWFRGIDFQFHGFGTVMASFYHMDVTFELMAVYTLVGCLVMEFLGLFNRRFMVTVSALYVLYVVMVIPLFRHYAGSWSEEFWFFLADYLILPLLWFFEIVAVEIVKGLFKVYSSRKKSSVSVEQ